MNEDKSARYHRLKRRASIASTLAGVAFLIAFVGSGVRLPSVTMPPRSRAHLSVTLVVYVVLLALVSEAIGLPFAFYEGVTLERRYGLSTETTARWWLDHLKASSSRSCSD